MEDIENGIAEGVKGQEPAAPEGVKGQGPAAPESDDVVIKIPADDGAAEKKSSGAAGVGRSHAETKSMTGDSGTGNLSPADTKADEAQSAEQRRAQAAARKAREKAEQQHFEAARAAAEQAKIDSIYANIYKGQTSPYSGKPINTERDYREYEAAKAKEARDNELRNAGLSEETIEQIVSEHPAVKQAETAMAQANAAFESAMETEANKYYDRAFGEISKLDAEVRDFDTLKFKYPETFDAIMSDHARGVDIVKAFRAENFEALEAKRAAAAKQAAINRQLGKDHLTTTPINGGNAVSIPRATLEYYRQLMPGKTDAEYAKHYASHHHS